jgi:hypothetical protein
VHSAKGTDAQGMVMAVFGAATVAAAAACAARGAAAWFLCAFLTGTALMLATHPASTSAQASVVLMSVRVQGLGWGEVESKINVCAHGRASMHR